MMEVRTLSSSKHRSLFAIALVLVLVSVACGPRQAPETTPSPVARVAESAPPAPTGPSPEELYEGLAYGRMLYEAAIDRIAEGEEVLGEGMIAESTGLIRESAQICATTPGCDLAPFFEAFDYLLNEQSIVLKQQAYQIEELAASAQEDVRREPGTSPFVATIRQPGESVSLLRGTELRDLITLNGPVNAAIDDWLTWMRPNLMQAYENYRYLRAEMAPVYAEAGLPEALLFAMMATESGGKVHAISRAGAAGPLQFMRYTGQRYGLIMDDGFDLRFDPEMSTRANVAYLNEQLEALDSSLEMALAAYNGGEHRMGKLHRRYPDTSFWDHRLYYSLPRETREYVPRVLAAAWLFLHADEYNLVLPDLEAETTTLTIRESIAVGELSICLGQEQNPVGWFRALRNLNPRLEPGDRIEAGTMILVPSLLVTTYEERCLQGDLVARARLLHEANYPDEPEMIFYSVRSGDTLGRIASRFQCTSVGQIAEINNVSSPRYVIHVGQQLKIPSCS